MNPNAPAIRVQNLSRRFDGRDRPALEAIEFNVPRGATLEILGPSGSGKSTLLNILGALDRPDSGRVEILGRDIAPLRESDLARLRGATVGTVFQHHCLPPGLVAIDAVAAPLLWLRAMEPAEAQRRAAALLESLGLSEKERTRPVQFLSGGQRQRVAFARAIAPRPAILLADEPTAQLDPENSTMLLKHLRDWAREEARTLVVATHAPLAGLPPERLTLRLELGRQLTRFTALV